MSRDGFTLSRQECRNTVVDICCALILCSLLLVVFSPIMLLLDKTLLKKIVHYLVLPSISSNYMTLHMISFRK